MKKILIPTDFSTNAYNAISYALKLYKDEEATFYLMNTYTPAVYQSEYLLFSPGQIGLGDIYQENSEKKLNEVKDCIIEEFGNPKHSFIIHSAFNTLVYEVVETTKNEKIDVVVMGTQGATGAKEILLGTNTVHVIKNAICPVLVVPPGYSFEIPKEILFPTDYEVDYKKTQLQQLTDIAKINGSKIDILYVSSGNELTPHQLENKSKLGESLANIPHRFHDVSDQEIITAINNFQTDQQINLLTMIRNKHTFLERLFIEPIIKKIGFHVTIPFLVLPHHSKE
ncbi:universal stress protein [Flavobacteriaceae bacterium KMM 6897]|nr:universal stress protein [Flavobacteriaceae bacterium KMM 6897]MEB8345219.1 universal stress protein [Flavobacteriaceae bacterium KMM 6898]